jgi:hypothetical protein
MLTPDLFDGRLLPEVPYPHGMLLRASGTWHQICSRCTSVYSFDAVLPATWLGAYDFQEASP